MTPGQTASLIYHLGESLWRATACTGNPSRFAEETARLMADVRPGDPCYVAFTLRHAHEDLVGTLISVEDEPYPDWDEQANGEPAPRRPVWTILTLDGRRMRWENVEVRRLPRGEREWEARPKLACRGPR